MQLHGPALAPTTPVDMVLSYELYSVCGGGTLLWDGPASRAWPHQPVYALLLEVNRLSTPFRSAGVFTFFVCIDQHQPKETGLDFETGLLS